MKQFLILMVLACHSVLLTDEQAKLMNVPAFPKLPYGIVGMNQRDTDSLALKKIGVSVETHGLIAHVVTELEYNNTNVLPIKDSKFVFPLDTNAAVFDLKVKCDEREEIVAKIDEKNAAKKQYRKALNEGHTAIYMGNKNDYGDVFSFSLGNIPGQATCKATFKYVQEMYKYNFEKKNMMFFRYPVELTHRYGERDFKGGFSQELSNVFMPSQNLKNRELDFTFKLKVVEPSTTSLDLNGDERFAITEDLQGLTFNQEYKFEKNIDVFIKLPTDNKPIAILEKGNPADANENSLSASDVLMINFNPELSELDSNADQEYVMVLDRSGSMASEMKTAILTVLEWIDQLPESEHCRFNIVSFGNRFVKWRENSVPCTEENKKEAKEEVRLFKADLGGTELYHCLDSVLQNEAPTGIKQVFVVTDGEICDTKRVIDLVGRKKHHNRIFSFGIGEDASSELVQGIAQFNGISKMLTKDVEFLQESVKHALSVSTAESFHNIDITIPSAKLLTKIPFGLFQGVPFSVYAKVPLDFPNDEKLTIKAKRSNGEDVVYSVPISISPVVVDHSDLPVHRLAAKRFIDELTNEDKRSNAEQILEISKNMNVVSKLTAFIGVSSERQKIFDDDLFEENKELDLYEAKKSYKPSYNTNECCYVKSTTSQFNQELKSIHYIPDNLFIENKMNFDLYKDKTKSYTGSSDTKSNECAFSKFKESPDVEGDLYRGSSKKDCSKSVGDAKNSAAKNVFLSYTKDRYRVLTDNQRSFPRSNDFLRKPKMESYAKLVTQTLSHTNNEELKAFFDQSIYDCEGKHGLTRFFTHDTGFCCDKCQTETKKDVAMHGCRECNFDLCENCVVKNDSWNFVNFPIFLVHKEQLYVPKSVNFDGNITTVVFQSVPNSDISTIIFQVGEETIITINNPSNSVDSEKPLPTTFLKESNIILIPFDEAREFFKTV